MTVRSTSVAFALGLQPHRSCRSRRRPRARCATCAGTAACTGWARIAITLSWISRVSCSRSSRPAATLDARLTSARLEHALRQHRLIDDQFADEIDQPVDAVEIDADRRRRLAAWRRSWRPRFARSGSAIDGVGLAARLAPRDARRLARPRRRRRRRDGARDSAAGSRRRRLDRASSAATISSSQSSIDEFEHLVESPLRPGRRQARRARTR